VFHFKSAVAPFKNDGIAKTAMYRYKFKRTPGAELFFGREMAKTVRSVYYDISFDGVAFVPMHPRRQMKRGFNQAEQFARVLADIMGLKLYDKLLSAKYSKVTQHSSSLKERFANVKDAYTFNHKVTGKTILLVDDIKTSGASLDACAKQLLLAGAENVYCITGLVTDKERKKVDGN
jgi:ComF family protein